MMKLILASGSPRRGELLQSLGYSFTTLSLDCDETFPPDLPAASVAGWLSELKSNAYTNLKDDEILITADTVVVCEGKILGKPKDKAEATSMLQQLSGRTHEVWTGITVRTVKDSFTESDVANVTFAELSLEEIEYYIETCRPFDKAGAYGIQEWIGMAKITGITGSFYTVMGLPTHLLYALLKKSGAGLL